MVSIFYFLGLIVSLALAGFFSSLETAFVCTDYLKIKKLKRTRPKAYLYLNKFFLKPERFLSTTLVGTNLCIITCSCLATSLLADLEVASPPFWVSVILTPVVLVFGEMFPKNTGRVFQSRFIIYFLGLFRFLELILRGIVYVAGFVPSKIIDLFFKDKKFTLNKDDIKILTETLHSQGKIERLEKEAIVDALGFSQTKIKDVYVPLKKVVAIDYSDTKGAVLDKAKKFGLTRYPVFKNGGIIGYLNIFDLFYKDASSWQDLIRALPRVGIDQRLDDVLSLLRYKKENMALVLKGRKAYGIVTNQDLIREIISALVNH